MTKFEFDKAVSAYLDGTANSWQVFIVEDYYDSFSHCKDYLDHFTEKELKNIGRNLFKGIDRRKHEKGSSNGFNEPN